LTSHVGLLVKLKWVLTWRGYRADKAKAFSSLILFICLVLISGLSVVALWYLFEHVEASLKLFVARDALAILYLLWAVTPLMGFHLNESYDVTKLFGYPITPRQMLVGVIAGSFLDISMLLLLPVTVLILLRFSPHFFAFLCNFVMLALFVVQTITMGQTVTLLLVGFLRSRRFRDMTVILLPLFSAISYLIQQTLIFSFQHLMKREVLDARVWQIAEFLPPGWTARAMQMMNEGSWGFALLFFMAMLQVFLATLAIASWSLDNLYRGDTGPRTAREPETVGASGYQRPIFGFIPPDIGAVLYKEWIYLRREPQYKALASQVVYMLVVLMVAFLAPSISRGSLPFGPHSQWAGPLLYLPLCTAVFSFSLPLLFNLFGGEGAAVTVLFSFPTPRRAFLLGKNIAHGSVLIGIMALSVTALAIIIGSWSYAGNAIAGTILATPILLGAGNLVSIRFPHRMLVRGQRWQRGGVASATGDAGCAYTLLYMVANMVTSAALLPVLAAVVAPLFFPISGPIYMVLLAAAFAYSITIYLFLLARAEEWLQQREPEIAERVVPAD
jgi:hypothetical protein